MGGTATRRRFTREFRLGSRQVVILEVLGRCLAPGHRYFKVRGDDGGTYILRYDVAKHHWELTMFETHDLPLALGRTWLVTREAV